VGTHKWNSARGECTSRTTGNRKGWRLPSVHELQSLLDPSVASPGPTLPAGHPFTNVLVDAPYWSATLEPVPGDLAAFAFSVWFKMFGALSSSTNFNQLPVWCVRGGMNADAY
jgi:hypothetical protein